MFAPLDLSHEGDTSAETSCAQYETFSGARRQLLTLHQQVQVRSCACTFQMWTTRCLQQHTAASRHRMIASSPHM